MILTSKLPLNPPSSVNISSEITVPAGMTELNDRSNQAQINTEITTGSTDTAVTSIQSVLPELTPKMQIIDELKQLPEIVFETPKPISYTIRYENK